MRICFTADQPNGLESVVSYHFGRCPYFVFVDVEGDRITNVETIENPMAYEHNVGDLPAFMKAQNVDVIITGGMGPRAQQFFASYGIKVVVGAYGKVKDVLEEYLQKKLSYEPQVATVEGEYEIEHKHEEVESEEVERLKKEITALRAQIAELKSRLKKLEERLK